MIRSSLFYAFAITCAFSTNGAYAQSAHVHGEGRLNVAIEGKRIFMALEAPGADIVGFEHKPASSADKAAVAAAIEQLDNPLQLMRFQGDADCRLGEKSARLEADEHEGHDEHDEHDGHEGHDDHDEDRASHSAFIAEYKFECGNIDALDAIEFSYFERFDNAQVLVVVLIHDSGQRRIEVDRANPVLLLGQ